MITNKQQGSIVIETAIILPLFLFLVFSGIELARGLFVRASLNHLLAEAAREIKLSPIKSGGYQAKIKAVMNRNDASLLDANLVKVVKEEFFDSPTELAIQSGYADRSGLVAPMALYRVEYDFSTLSPWLKTLNFDTEILVKYEV